MNICLATPYLSSQHWDSGMYWFKALNQLGHSVAMWDYRLEPEPQPAAGGCSVFLGMKTGAREAAFFHRSVKKAVYWPDDFARSPEECARLLEAYHVVATPVRPTPPGCLWLPTGWDPDIHRDVSPETKLWDSVFIGTGTPRKAMFLKAMGPSLIFGNSWEGLLPLHSGGKLSAGVNPPVYLHEYVRVLSSARVSINVHHGDVGLNRRFFESSACALTLTDRVPGVEEVLGPELADAVSFRTPGEGQYMLKMALAATPVYRLGLATAVRAKLAPYTYEAAAKRLLEALCS